MRRPLQSAGPSLEGASAMRRTLWVFGAAAIFAAGAATAMVAQQGQPQAPRVRDNPDPNCTATPAQLEANKQLVMNPVSNPNDRIYPSYKQHNPAFIKGGREAGMTDYAYFMSRFGGPGRGPGGGAPGGRGQAAGPQPPAGDPFDIVVAECDIVATFHMNYRQDPTAAPGTWFQAYTFDTWRVRN